MTRAKQLGLSPVCWAATAVAGALLCSWAQAGYLEEQIPAYPAMVRKALAEAPRGPLNYTPSAQRVLGSLQAEKEWGKDASSAAIEQRATQLAQEGKPFWGILEPLLMHSCRTIRVKAIVRLSTSDDLRALPILRKRLSDIISLPPVKGGGPGSPEDVAFLVRMLGNLRVRACGKDVLDALTWAKTHKVVPANSIAESVTTECVKALGRLRYPRGASAICDALSGLAATVPGQKDVDEVLEAFNLVTTADFSWSRPKSRIPGLFWVAGGNAGLPDTPEGRRARATTNRQLDREIAECKAALRGLSARCAAWLGSAASGPREVWLRGQLRRCGVSVPAEAQNDPGGILMAATAAYCNLTAPERASGEQAAGILRSLVRYGHPLVIPAFVDLLDSSEPGEVSDIENCLEATRAGKGDVYLGAVGNERQPVGSSKGPRRPRPPLAHPGRHNGAKGRWTDWWQKRSSFLIYAYESLTEGSEGKAQALPAKVSDEASEARANRQLALARNYLRSNLRDKGRQLLEAVVRDYPGTAAAKLAKADLESLK